MVKEWHCESCGKWRTTDDKIVMKICVGCQTEMKEIKERYEVIEDGYG
jgi:hypothetical protein